MTKQCKEIIDKYINSELEVLRLSKVAIEQAETMFLENKKDLVTQDWDMIDGISDAIWESDKTIDEKIQLGLEFFEVFPQYYMGLLPIYRAFTNDLVLKQDLKKIIYDKFAEYLSSARKAYINTTGYVLWVEFFEGSGPFSREIWEGIISSSKISLQGKYNLLEFSGPADYDQKEKLYAELIENKESHLFILKSIVYSLTDVYGRIEKDKVIKIFNKLDNVDKYSEIYKVANEKLFQH